MPSNSILEVMWCWLHCRSVCLHMISTLRQKQIEQIDPWPLNWQKHFNSSSVKITVNVCRNVATGKFPHCTTVNDCTHGHTQTHTWYNTGGQLSLWMTVSTKEYWLVGKGKKNTLIAIQPQTHFNTSSSVCVCVFVSGSLSAFQFVFQPQSEK